jgi:hypothetical protein
MAGAAGGGTELIDLDFLLTEPRNTEDDKDLAAALADAGNVIIAAQVQNAQLPPQEPLPMFCDPDPVIMVIWKSGPLLTGVTLSSGRRTNVMGEVRRVCRRGS